MLDRNWHQMGDPASPMEAEGLEEVRRLLGDDAMCHAWANLVFPDHTGAMREMDLLLLHRQGLFVLELKSWSGQVIGQINRWQRKKGDRVWDLDGSPLAQATTNAKLLKGLLERLEQEERTRARLPWVHPAVVMHGRDSTIKLSRETAGEIYGLDRFGVKGVPGFSELLKRSRRGSPMDKPTFDAVLRLIQKSGLAPRSAQRWAEDAVITTTRVPQLEHGIDVPSPPQEPPVPPFLADLSDEQLERLGASIDDLPLIRQTLDVVTLIGRIPDELWDDLDAVAGGEAVDEVIDRRRRALERFAQVDEAARRVDWEPEPDTGQAPLSEPAPAVASDPVPPPMSETERLLRDAFGDRVRTTTGAQHKWSKPAPSESRRGGASDDVESVAPSRVIPVETLLILARTEALAGRVPGAQALHAALSDRLNTEMKVDWSPVDVARLGQELGRFPVLAARLERMSSDLHGGETLVLNAMASRDGEVGAIWHGRDPGPAYSLLVRVPDILERQSGLFLSQLIGAEAAAAVNARLRGGRPDGGRIRIVDGGMVVSRRDPRSPWFIVGHVSAEEWFPAERILAA